MSKSSPVVAGGLQSSRGLKMADPDPLGASWEFSGGPLDGSFTSDLDIQGLEPTSFSPGPSRVSRLGRRIPQARQGKPAIHAKALVDANAKDARELRKEVLALTKRAETAEEKVGDFREKLKAARAALAAKDKQLGLAKRSVEYLGAERDQLQATVVNDQAHTRKLEVKLMGQQGLAEITAQWKSMKTKVKAMENTVRAAESKLLAAEEVQRRQKAEINTLRVALDVKARELSAIGGQEISSRLIYAVAKSREEGVALAVQLAEQRDSTSRTETELSKAQLEIQRLQDSLEAQRAARELAETATIQAQAESRHARANAEAAAAQIQAAEQSQQRIHEDKQNLQEELRELRNRVAEFEDALESEQRSARRAAESSRQDMVVALADVTRAATEQQEELRRKAQELKRSHKEEEAKWAEERAKWAGERDQLLQRAGAAETEAAVCRGRAEEAESTRELRVGELQARAGELQAEISNLNSDIDSMTEVNHKLQGKLDAALQAREAEEQRCSQLNQRIEDFKDELEETRKAASATSQAKVNNLLTELGKAQEDRDRLSAELTRALEEGMAVAAGTQVAESEAKRLKEINESLSFSKADMQRTMMEQIAGLQGQLQALQKENAQLREWNPPTISAPSETLSAPPPTIGNLAPAPEPFPGEHMATQKYHQAAGPSGRPAPRRNLYSPTGEAGRGYGPAEGSHGYNYAANNSHGSPMQPAALPTWDNPGPDAALVQPRDRPGQNDHVPFDAVNAYSAALRTSRSMSMSRDEGREPDGPPLRPASPAAGAAASAYQASAVPWQQHGQSNYGDEDGLRSPPDSPGNYRAEPISPHESPVRPHGREGPREILSLSDLANLDFIGRSP